MSLSAHVFSRRPLETIGAWQAAFDALRFKLIRSEDPDRRIETLGGHLPALWEGLEAGFECLPYDAGEIEDFVEDCEEVAPGGPWAYGMEISYLGHANIAGVAIAGAAYADATGGLFWEGEAGERIDADAAPAYALRVEVQTRAFLAEMGLGRDEAAGRRVLST